MTATLEHGVIDGMDERQYHAHPALSSGGVRDLLPPSTPAKFRWKRDHPEPPTNEMEIGTATHTQVFGVGQGWELAPERWQSNADKATVAEIRSRGLIPLKPADAALVAGMARAVREHPDAGPLLAEGVGIPERALFWRDEATGVDCRALIDWSLNNGRALVDLKTSRTAAPSALPRLVADRGYFVQGAHYLRGARALGLADEHTSFVLVVVEREPPHGISVVRLDPDDLEWADGRCSRAYEIFRDCSAVDIWPSYPIGLSTIRLPGWARREDDNETW